MDFTQKQISLIKAIAHDLIDDGMNEEYVRGICELIGDIDPVEGVCLGERRDEIKKELLTPYYQPDLDKVDGDELASFEVFPSEENAKKGFSGNQNL